MAHARVIAIREVAAPAVEERLRTVERLDPGLELGDVIEVLGVLNVLIDVNRHAAHGVGKGREPIKRNLGIVRDLDSALLAHNLHHAGCAIVGVDPVDLHGRALPLDHGVTRNREERHALVGRVDAGKNDGIGTVVRLARPAVSSKEQHVVGVIWRCRGIVLGRARQALLKLGGNDLAVVHPRLNVVDPQSERRSPADKDRH